MTTSNPEQRADIAEIIHDILDQASAMFASEKHADEIVDYLYWPEIIAVLEGDPTIFRGTRELLPFARQFVPQLGRNVDFHIDDPITISADMASAVVKVISHYEDKSDEINYALYVWQRREDDWKIIQEMLCVGHAK